MATSGKLFEKIKSLPPAKRREVEAFVESLRPPAAPMPLKSLKGLWKNLDIHITEEDIAQARREMWGNFPRDIRE